MPKQLAVMKEEGVGSLLGRKSGRTEMSALLESLIEEREMIVVDDE